MEPVIIRMALSLSTCMAERRSVLVLPREPVNAVAQTTSVFQMDFASMLGKGNCIAVRVQTGAGRERYVQPTARPVCTFLHRV